METEKTLSELVEEIAKRIGSQFFGGAEGPWAGYVTGTGRKLLAVIVGMRRVPIRGEEKATFPFAYVFSPVRELEDSELTSELLKELASLNAEHLVAKTSLRKRNGKWAILTQSEFPLGDFTADGLLEMFLSTAILARKVDKLLDELIPTPVS